MSISNVLRNALIFFFLNLFLFQKYDFIYKPNNDMVHSYVNILSVGHVVQFT